jgi:hypothetical protein
MAMAGVVVVVEMRMTGMTVVMFMRMGGHPPYSTCSTAEVQPFPALITHYDTLPPRID